MLKNKKIYSLLFAVALFSSAALVSCGDDKDDNDGNPSETLSGFDENGASLALFSVGENKQVRFSRGNLQYKASDKTWRFAEHQYDCIGEGNNSMSTSYAGWIDLFGWGTSGWSGSGANIYEPGTISESHLDYYIGGIYTNNLTGDYAQADWGVYNSITNGGNRPGMWRTLTASEWNYLVTREGKTGAACVNGQNGLVILPDSWETPSGLNFVAVFDDSGNTDNPWELNTYTAEEWTKMETAGAIFLPAAGRCDAFEPPVGFNYYNVVGGYWSSTTSGAYSDYFADYMRFDMGQAPHIDGWYRNYGTSVRLVRAE